MSRQVLHTGRVSCHSQEVSVLLLDLGLVPNSSPVTLIAMAICSPKNL